MYFQPNDSSFSSTKFLTKFLMLFVMLEACSSRTVTWTASSTAKTGPLCLNCSWITRTLWDRSSTLSPAKQRQLQLEGEQDEENPALLQIDELYFLLSDYVSFNTAFCGTTNLPIVKMIPYSEIPAAMWITLKEWYMKKIHNWKRYMKKIYNWKWYAKKIHFSGSLKFRFPSPWIRYFL